MSFWDDDEDDDIYLQAALAVENQLSGRIQPTAQVAQPRLESFTTQQCCRVPAPQPAAGSAAAQPMQCGLQQPQPNQGMWPGTGALAAPPAALTIRQLFHPQQGSSAQLRAPAPEQQHAVQHSAPVQLTTQGTGQAWWGQSGAAVPARRPVGRQQQPWAVMQKGSEVQQQQQQQQQRGAVQPPQQQWQQDTSKFGALSSSFDGYALQCQQQSTHQQCQQQQQQPSSSHVPAAAAVHVPAQLPAGPFASQLQAQMQQALAAGAGVERQAAEAAGPAVHSEGQLAQWSAEHSWSNPPGQSPQPQQLGSAVGDEGDTLAANLSEQQAGQQRPPGAPGMHGASATAANSGPAGAGQAQGAGAERRSGKLKQLFDYLLVIDIEATCDQEKKLHPQEIIELSACLVNTRTLQLEGPHFQRYCRPTTHPQLTQFCTELTGITQEQVDAGISLEAALKELTTWVKERGVTKSFVSASWTDWDLKVMMKSECKWRQLQKPKFLERWVDLKAVYVKHYKQRLNLKGSVEHAGLEWEGRAHSAIDDAVNTARLAIKLMQRGIVLGITGSFTGVDASGRFKQTQLFPGRPAKKQKTVDEEGRWNGKCHCGAKAKKRTVKRPGPNNGKDFWSCGRYTATGGATCDFFKWLDQK